MRDALNTFLHNAEGLGSSPFLLFLLLVLIAMGLWSAFANKDSFFGLTGPAANNIFLGVRMQTRNLESAGGVGDFIGHIVDLDSNRATFISPVFIPKGEEVTMSFASIPDFPAPTEPYTVRVLGGRVVRGQPPTYLINASFASLAPNLRSPLMDYLRRLARRRRLSPAS